MYFESHAHYDDKRFNSDREELLSKTLPDAGITHIINVGADMASSHKSVNLADKYDYIYASVGVHPHEVKSMTDEDIVKLTKMAENKKVVAIGEIGLDYYHNFSPRDAQVHWFLKQLELATDLLLPVIIHSRDATKETLDILTDWNKQVTPLIKGNQDRKGVIHCFSASADIAMEYVKMGFYIGLGGVLTYSNAKKTVEVAEAVPLDRIVIETDCPYLSPVPNRGKRNDSKNLSFIVEKIAQIKQISHDEAAYVTKQNSLYLFFMK